MKIRSNTYFSNPGYPLKENVLREAGDFLFKAKSAYAVGGYEVQTVRVATVSFAKLLGEKHIDELPKYAEQFTQVMKQNSVVYAALGPALPELPRSYQVIPGAIAASEGIFFSGVMADVQTVHMAQVKACAGDHRQVRATRPERICQPAFHRVGERRRKCALVPRRVSHVRPACVRHRRRVR